MENPVLCFDRDQTVDVNPPENGVAVPLHWVQYYAHYTDHHVWATGNQQLQIEAGIPTPYEARNLLIENGYSISSPPGGGDKYRYDRLRIVQRLYNEIMEDAELVVVDDADLINIGNMKQWSHYKPDEFVEAVESQSLKIPIPEEGLVSGKPYNNTNQHGTYRRTLDELSENLSR